MGYPIALNQTAQPLTFFMTDSSDHISGKTGLAGTMTVKISKNGAAGISPSGTIAEIDSTNLPGWYKVAGNSTDSNTLGPLLLHASASGADPTDECYPVVDYNMQDATRLGLAALPNANAAATGGLPTVDSANGVKVSVGTSTGQINASSGKVPATLASTDVTGNVASDIQTIKAQTVTCSGGVTVPAATLASTINITAGTITTVSGNVSGNVVGDVQGKIIGGGLSSITGIGAEADLQTIKGQTVTCSGGVTVPASTLASTTNITAGTITTVTNLTNAPTSGDFTTTMKTSLGTAVAASAVASVTGDVGGKVLGGGLSSITGVGAEVDLQTIKGQTVACSAGVTVEPIVGNATHAIVVDSSGNVTFNNSSIGSVTGSVGSVTGAVGSVTGNVGGNVVGSVGSVTGAVGSVTGNVGGNVVGSVGSISGVTFPTHFSALAINVSGAVTIDGTSPMTEGYTTGAFTLEQGLYEIAQVLGQNSIASTTITVQRRDKATTAATFTLDDATAPTSRTRAT